MNNQEGLEFIRKYFDELFGKRNLDALDFYLDRNYFDDDIRETDDDIGETDVDHIKNSKAFLKEWFRTRPSIGVDVKDAMAQDDVIDLLYARLYVKSD